MRAGWEEPWSRLLAFREHLPELYEIPETLVRTYHDLVSELGSVTRLDLKNFRIPPEEIRPKVVSGNLPRMGRAGNVNYSSDNYCLRTNLLMRLDGLIRFVEPQLRSAEASAPPAASPAAIPAAPPAPREVPRQKRGRPKIIPTDKGEGAELEERRAGKKHSGGGKEYNQPDFAFGLGVGLTTYQNIVKGDGASIRNLRKIVKNYKTLFPNDPPLLLAELITWKKPE
jgi:hypothetical protein